MSGVAVPRVLTEPVGGSPLSLLAQRGEAPAGWYEPTPADAAGWIARARTIARADDAASRLAALAPAMRAGGAAAERVARVVRDGGFVVTTGQQPGLFGGPGYTWTKALAAKALADGLERASGVPAVAVFWAATDDADAAEASETTIAVVGGAERLVAPVEAPAGTPMCAAPLGDVAPQLERLAASAGSVLHPGILEAARVAYSADATVGGAYVALLEQVLNPLGIAVLDAGHALVRRLAAPITTAALAGARGIAEALAARGGAIRAGGFAPQVEEMENLSLVFDWSGGVKRRVPVGGAAGAEAELSPNVLLRPVVERFLLPTVAYVAGPGELAYFAQVGAVADALGAARPLAVARWSCTVVEPRVERALARLQLSLEDARDEARASAAIARRAMPEDAARVVELARRQADELRAALAPLARGPALLDERVVEGQARQAEHFAARLERRLLAAVKRREVEAMQLLGTVRGSLWPNGTRQERALNYLPFFARYGPALLDRMREGAARWAETVVGD